MPTLEEALEHLGIDYPDDTIKRIVTKKLATAVRTLRGAVGDDVDSLLPDDPRTFELVMIYLDDLYSNRSLTAKVSGATRALVHTMELQLRLDLRAIREGAGE